MLIRPIIIIGSGRSGSSLLNGVLGEHPDILMLGETRFAFPRIWSLLSQCDGNARLLDLAFEEYYDADDSEETARDPLPEKYKTLLTSLQREDAERKAGLLRETLDRWFRITDSGSRAWGFKEI